MKSKDFSGQEGRYQQNCLWPVGAENISEIAGFPQLQ
jgi:hypothetical protein